MKKLENVIIVLFIIIIMVSLAKKAMDGDTFFTIANGRLILEEGLSNEEKLVWHEGLEFQNPRWLFDVLIASIYNSFGFDGIYVLILIMSSIEGVLYYCFLNSIIKNKWFSFFATIISMTAIKASLIGRSFLFSNTMLLIEFYCLEKIKNADKIKARYLIILSILPILFINIHGAIYVVYLIEFIPYIAEYLIFKLIIRDKDTRFKCDIKNIKVMIILFVIALLESFVRPASLSPFSYMFKTMQAPSASFISELKTLSLFNSGYLSLIIIGIISLMIVSKQKFRISDLLFILGFYLVAMKNFRGIYFFVMTASICAYRIFIEFMEEYDFSIKSEKTKKVILVLSVPLVLIHYLSILTNRLSHNYVVYENYPIGVVDYINENIDKDKMKLYNSFNYGSYLEFRGIKTFMDSRAEIYSEGFNPGCTIMQDYKDILECNKNYNTIFDEYGVTHVLVNFKERFYDFIVDDPKWKKIYQDNSFSLYERAQ